MVAISDQNRNPPPTPPSQQRQFLDPCNNTLLAAFGSCLAVGIHANAVAQRIPIRALELELESDINTTAVWGTGDLNPKTIGFEGVRVQVRLDADAPRKVLVALVKHATLWSPVANTLHNPVHLDVTLAPASVGKTTAKATGVA